MNDTSITHMPSKSKWEFDASVADVFDDMLERSIPQYDLMRDTVHQLARRHVVPGGSIVDLGCSRGGALARLVDDFGSSNRYFGVDVSKPMLTAARERFAAYPPGIVQIDELDLRTAYPDVGGACVTMAVLSLQFVPINYRQQIIANVFDHTRDQGAFLMVEKVLGSGARIDDMMVDMYHHMKAGNGYSKEAIDRKRLALEGVLVPVTAQWNEQLLRQAGFREVDCVWRWLNFAAWIAVK